MLFNILTPLVAAHGVRVAMGTLNRLGSMDLDVHHRRPRLGSRRRYRCRKAGGDLSRPFAELTEIFQSGCYHGVIQAYFERVHAVDTQP